MEDIEDPKHLTYTVIPESNNGIDIFLDKHKASFWVEHDIDNDLKHDLQNWDNFSSDIQHFIKHIIAFFLIGDGLVNENIAEHIESRITVRKIQMWYNFQKAMEDIHNITYSKLADAYIKDKNERKKIFSAIENYNVIKQKVNWVKKWLGESNDLNRLSQKTLDDIKIIAIKYANICACIDTELPDYLQRIIKKMSEPNQLLGKQILINIIMEGLFFSGSFAAIFWLVEFFPNNQMPGLLKANELISRDEGLHTDAGIELYNTYITNKLPEQTVHEIISEAVEIEYNFICEALPNKLKGMNSDLMIQYIKFVADKLLTDLHYKKIYNVNNPFGFMKKQSISVRNTDFFMGTVTEYGHADKTMIIDDL